MYSCGFLSYLLKGIESWLEYFAILKKFAILSKLSTLKKFISVTFDIKFFTSNLTISLIVNQISSFIFLILKFCKKSFKFSIMSSRTRSRSRSRSNKSKNQQNSQGAKTNAQGKRMICVCIPEEDIRPNMCTCGMPLNNQKQQQQQPMKNQPLQSSTRIDYSDHNESIYEMVKDESLLDVEDDPMNACKLGLMYRTNSFRWLLLFSSCDHKIWINYQLKFNFC